MIPHGRQDPLGGVIEGALDLEPTLRLNGTVPAQETPLVLAVALPGWIDA
jgi:hypothetical protein